MPEEDDESVNFVLANKKTSRKTKKDVTVKDEVAAPSVKEVPAGVGGRYNEIGAGRRVRISDK